MKLSSRYRVDKNGTVLLNVVEKPEETTEDGQTGGATTESGGADKPEGTTEARNGNGGFDGNTGYANDTQSALTTEE